MPVHAAFSRRPQAAVWGGVALLHALVLGLLLSQRHDGRQRGAVVREQAPLMLQLPRLLLPAPAAPAPTPRSAATTPVARPAESTASPPPAPVIEPQAITVPPPEPAAPVASAPLNLVLPRAPQAPWRNGRNPALDDPRANTTRLRTIEDRIAGVLGGSDQITEEHLADGSVRFRRGPSCVIARPNRAQAIDPFNASVSPKPRLIDSC